MTQKRRADSAAGYNVGEAHSVGLRGSGFQIGMKETGYGLRIIMPELPDENFLLELLMRIPPSAWKLPEGSGIALDFQGRSCSQELLLDLMRSIVCERKVPVIAWLSTNKSSNALFRSAGLTVSEPEDAGKTDQSCENMILYSSLRSGEIKISEGDVILWGHMNSGAEIFAGGNVIIAGRLRGLVHAGYGGRSDVFVLAGAFEAQQVRLGNKICYAPSPQDWQGPVLITLEDGMPTVHKSSFLKAGTEQPPSDIPTF